METNNLFESEEIAKHEFDFLKPCKNTKINFNRVSDCNLEEVINISKVKIPNSISDKSLIREIIKHNNDNVFCFTRNHRVIGFCAMLMLSPLGLERLLLDEFDGKNPDFKCLSKTEETTAAIYIWGLVASGFAIEGVRHMSQFLQQSKYKTINFFSRPNTDAGVRININLGFKPVENAQGDLYRYVRIVNRELNLQRSA